MQRFERDGGIWLVVTAGVLAVVGSLVLRFFLDLSVAETAERLRIPEGTVKSCAHRGLAQLRDLLPMPDKETHHAER